MSAARTADEVQWNYSVSFSDDATLQSVIQPDNVTYWNHWVFPIAIQAGMSSARVQVQSLLIQPQCDVPGKANFYHGNLIPPVNSLLTPAVSVDTTQPVIVNCYTSKPAGTYTAGDSIYIIVEFSREVAFSELPSVYSQVYIDAAAAGAPTACCGPP